MNLDLVYTDFWGHSYSIKGTSVLFSFLKFVNERTNNFT